MKRIFVVFIFLISCKQEVSLAEKYEITYLNLISENEKFNNLLLENIEPRLNVLSNTAFFSTIKIYDSLTNEYFTYLDFIETEIKNKGNGILFENLEYSEIGKEYVAKTGEFLSEISDLIEDESFKNRINLVFNTDDVEQNDEIKTLYLDYYFRGYPQMQSIYRISLKKRMLLNFENEFLDKMIILLNK